MNQNTAKSRLWVDGDAFRAPAGTVLPTGVVIPTGKTLFTASTFTGWEPYGAIKAGFELTPTQESNNLGVWGNDSYRKNKKKPVTSIALRPVEETKATILTFLQGGSIAETASGSGVWEWIGADDEEFALLLITRDPGHGSKAYLAQRVTMDNIPGEKLDDSDLNGYDITVTALTPTTGGLAVRRFSDSNPLATS